MLLKAIVPKSDIGFQYEEGLPTKHFASHNKNILYYLRNKNIVFQDYTGLIPKIEVKVSFCHYVKSQFEVKSEIASTTQKISTSKV